MESKTGHTGLALLRWPALLAGILGALTLVCARGAEAATPQGFVAAPAQLTMAPWASANDVAIQASDCGGSTDSCVATGYFEDSTNSYSPLVVPVIDGVPGNGSLASLPADADATGHPTNLVAVSCWDAADCAAAGNYSNSAGHSQALVVPISAGAPDAGAPVSLPANANATPVSSLLSVGCAYAASCIAVGSYRDTANNTEALVVPIAGGTVGSGVEVAPPAGSAPNGAQDMVLTDVACWSAGACVGVGYYKDNNGDFQALVVPIIDGVPGPAVGVTPPIDTAVAGSSTVPDATLAKVSCWGAGSCVAVGSYATSANNLEGLLVPITGGVPGNATAALLPANAATAASTQNASLNDVSCTPDGRCAAVGDYLVSTTDQEPFAEPIVGQVVGAGEEVSLPANAGIGMQDAALQFVSCPPTTACAAAGSYTDGYGDTEELTAAIEDGIAGAGSEPPTFANESFTYPFTQLRSVSCADSGSCLVLGIYANTSGVQVPTVFGLQAPLSVTTTALPPARKGSSYQATLSAAGAWGSYSWSLSSGHLPAGLTLNAHTGAITGTPVATGASAFTVTVTGTGAPAQAASQRLDIAVAAALRPHVSVAHGSLPVIANRLQLTLGCSGSACRGTVRFQATEVVTVKEKVKYFVKVKVKIKAKAKRKHGRKHKAKARIRREVRYRTELVHQNRTVVIAGAGYSLAVGGSRSVTITLNNAGRNLLNKARGHRLTTSLYVVTAGGNHVTRSPLSIIKRTP